MKTPSISQYLLSTCLYTIDELNEQYSRLTKEKLKSIADDKFNEMDITVRLGYPFKQMVHYTVGDAKPKGSKVNHDLYVESKEFKIEIKYLKNWKSTVGTSSNSKTGMSIKKISTGLLRKFKEVININVPLLLAGLIV